MRVQEGYTCDCFDGFQLDLKLMACVGKNHSSMEENMLDLAKNSTAEPKKPKLLLRAVHPFKMLLNIILIVEEVFSQFVAIVTMPKTSKPHHCLVCI